MNGCEEFSICRKSVTIYQNTNSNFFPKAFQCAGLEPLQGRFWPSGCMFNSPFLEILHWYCTPGQPGSFRLEKVSKLDISVLCGKQNQKALLFAYIYYLHNIIWMFEQTFFLPAWQILWKVYICTTIQLE